MAGNPGNDRQAIEKGEKKKLFSVCGLKPYPPS
jgi:hypothetical protein